MKIKVKTNDKKNISIYRIHHSACKVGVACEFWLNFRI